MDLSAGGARTGSAGHSGTSHVIIIFPVLIWRTSMFVGEKTQTGVFRNTLKMSDSKSGTLFCAGCVFPGSHVSSGLYYWQIAMIVLLVKRVNKILDL